MSIEDKEEVLAILEEKYEEEEDENIKSLILEKIDRLNELDTLEEFYEEYPNNLGDDPEFESECLRKNIDPEILKMIDEDDFI